MSNQIAGKARQVAIYLLFWPVVNLFFCDMFFGFTPSYLRSIISKDWGRGVFIVFLYFVLPSLLLAYIWPKVLKIRNKNPEAWFIRGLVWMVLLAALFYLVMDRRVYVLQFFMNNVPAWLLSFLWICCVMDEPPPVPSGEMGSNS
ncbi:MAG: hypothetical protein JST01_05070 [Cyanobacteria bacterium SZAS TMP-1]|nr:hypothetical protein [Cyanobacteria bacterium SZAS TMP-1]